MAVESCSTPVPSLVMLPFWMTELMIRPWIVAPLPTWKSEAAVAPPSTVMLWPVLLRSSQPPAMFGAKVPPVMTAVGVEETLPVRVRTPLALTNGIPKVLPLLVKTKPAWVLLLK